MAYAPCGAQHKDAVQVTLEQIDLIKRLVETYPNHLELVKTADGRTCFISNDKNSVNMYNTDLKLQTLDSEFT